MNLKATIKKIENQLKLSNIPDVDLDGRFSGWTDDELENYAINGIKPEGKPIGYISKKSLSKFDGWTDEELEIYATTGEKPESKRS